MNRYKELVIAIMVLFLIFIHAEYSFCHDNHYGNKNVYMIIVNKMTLSDIDNMPNLLGLIEDSSIGLMNVRGLNGYRGAESFATINASNKAFANYDSSQFHNLDKEFKAIYESRIGLMDKQYEVGNIQMGRLYNQNEDNKYSPFIGALGYTLHKSGLKTAVFGNSDTDEELIRTSALIPMDPDGLIDYGNVDDILVKDNFYPYGIRTDYDKILDEIERVKSDASLIVVDTGDLNRLNSYGANLSTDEFYQKRNVILNNIDEFIEGLLNIIDKDNSLLMILSPNSGEERIDGNRLSPIIIWGKNVMKGIVVSNTTRQNGIIANLDISPTVVKFLDLKPENMAGNPIEYVEIEDSLNYIKSIIGPINLMSKTRSKTLSTYGTISLVIILLIIALVLLNIVPNEQILRGLKTGLLLIYVLPLAFMIISSFRIDNLIIFILALTLFSSLVIYVFYKCNSSKNILVVTYLYFILLFFDILLKGYFTKYSVLSHDPIIGARYFGIGNEMVGLFLMVSCMTAGLLYEKYSKKIIPILVMIGTTVLVGHPNLGANVGGTIALLSSSIYFVCGLYGKNLNLKNTILTLFIIGMAIGFLGYLDIRFSHSPTHLGNTLLSINEKGIGFVKNIIDRKLLMNVRLIGISFWTRVIIINIFAQIIVSHYYRDRVNSFMVSRLGNGYLSCIAGSIIGFLVNDSGLILSAISINMATILLLFIVIGEQDKIGQEVDEIG
ncbi:hypothetical protein [Tepidimicrobium xylanilyticum]